MNQKYALCIGNNYPDTDSELSGCVNDAEDWAEVAASRGYQVEMLLNDGATRSEMVAGFEDVVARTGWGDRALIFNSGHGTYRPDLDGDEPDRRDEAICPADFQTRGVITDDEMFRIFSRKRYGARIVAFFDTCHSGTATRSLMASPSGRSRVKYVPPSTYLTGADLELAERAEASALGLQGRPTVPLMAAAAASEYAWDAWFIHNGQWRANGAFTYHAIQVLKENPTVTYSRWAKSLGLPTGDYPQTPQYDPTTYASRYWKALA